jgi:hypothetical protein
MTGAGLDLSIDRLVLDVPGLPEEAAVTLGRLVEDELRQIFDGGGPSSIGSARAELELLVLSTPPDVPALARALAGRIADRAAGVEAWDG